MQLMDVYKGQVLLMPSRYLSLTFKYKDCIQERVSMAITHDTLQQWIQVNLNEKRE